MVEKTKKIVSEVKPEWDTFDEDVVEKAMAFLPQYRPRKNSPHELISLTLPTEVKYMDKETLENITFHVVEVMSGKDRMTYKANQSFLLGLKKHHRLNKVSYAEMVGKRFELYKNEKGFDSIKFLDGDGSTWVNIIY